MFKNIFKKKSEVIVIDEPKIDNIITITKQSYPKEVLEIHHEFETAAEKLLDEANEIINSQPKVNESKINLLKNLGFKQVKEVQEGSEIIAKIELSKEQIELVNYYQQNYPFNKFITEEQVKTICHKYNLVCGNVDRFKGFVPEKNVNEIVNFKLKEEESNSIIINFTPYKSNKQIELILKNAEIRKSNTEYFHIYNRNNQSEYKSYAFQSDNGINFYGDDLYDIFGYKHLGSGRFTLESNNLKICAPVKDMDISGLELKEGYKLEKQHIPDPVVLQPVKGGYLILTAWGDEASDPLVVNQNFN